jgi:hypothetical protein
MYLMYFLPQKAVGFETSCVNCVVYGFFKTTKCALLLTSDVQVAPLYKLLRCTSCSAVQVAPLYNLLYCPEIPWCSFSVLPIRALKIISNRSCIY